MPCISFDSTPWQLRQNCAAELPEFGLYQPRTKNMVGLLPATVPSVLNTVMLC